MIDINNIVNTAIQQEVSKIITDHIDPYIANMQRDYREQVKAMREELNQFMQQQLGQHADNPATGVDTTLARDVKALLESDAGIKQAVYEIAYSAAESVMDEHTSSYDHDQYDETVSAVEDLPSEFPDFDDLVTKDELRDAQATVSFRI